MKTAVLMFLMMTILGGIIHPFFVTIFAQVAFNHKANGSLIREGDKVIGSELLAQGFASDKYFWPRPSAVNYDGRGSGASNLAAVAKKRLALMREDQTSSASGLDPHISMQTAYAQVSRVAQARGVTREHIEGLVRDAEESRDLGFLGQKRVNVLMLNRHMDQTIKVVQREDNGPPSGP